MHASAAHDPSPMVEDRFEAIVVGGGPAGCLSALGLARQGLRTAIVDRAASGRDKCCGHCLNPRVSALLARHGLLESVESIAVGRTRTLAIEEARGRGLLELRLDSREGDGGWLVPRDRLDGMLWDAAIAAGAMAMRPASARLIETVRGEDREDAVVELEQGSHRRRVACGLLVAADGLGSGIARRAGLAASRSGRGFGFSASLEPAEAWSSALGLRRDQVLMLVDPAGYLGLVREADPAGGERVHAAGLVRERGGVRRSPREFVRAILQSRSRLDPALEGLVAAGPMPWRPKRATRGAIALVGDAAGYVEPFTGEGMAWAFESADALVAAVEAHGGWNLAAESAYARSHRQRIAAAQRGCSIVAGAIARPGLLRIACGVGRGVMRTMPIVGRPLVEAALLRGLVTR